MAATLGMVEHARATGSIEDTAGKRGLCGRKAETISKRRRQALEIIGVPNRIRTGVAAVKGRVIRGPEQRVANSPSLDIGQLATRAG